MRRKRTVLMAPVASAAIVALVIAGCGSGSDNVKASAPAASMKASAPSGAGATVDVRTGGLGSYLVDSQGRTLYLFEKDKGTKSMCSGACASAWPTSTTSGRPTAGSSMLRSMRKCFESPASTARVMLPQRSRIARVESSSTAGVGATASITASVPWCRTGQRHPARRRR